MKLFSEMEETNPADEWKGMPEFHQEDLTPMHSINVRFKNAEDMENFAKLVDQKINLKTKTIWFPFAPFRRASLFEYADEPR